ncbi:CgeB family protein [Haloarcula marina]|uniref:CgeB family protein n=1 Tax=Haloarcula marina TaxID=2961574 RepID=UPI0020B6446E|nr:glycosyltransferase [Halomicroarcula marina]
MILVIKGYELDRETVASIGTIADAPVVNWNPDNPFQVRSKRRRAEQYLDALPAYDLVYTWGRHLIDPLRSEGAARVEHLPFAHDPFVHHPREVTPAYACEITFVGQWSPKRESILRTLTDYDLQVRGLWWNERCSDPELRSCVKGGHLDAEEYAKAINAGSIVINVVGDHNLPYYNMRTFEIPAVRSVMATTRSEGQQEVFTDGVDCLMYDGPDELATEVDRLLNDRSRLSEVAANGHETVQEHTYRARMESFLQTVKAL